MHRIFASLILFCALSLGALQPAAAVTMAWTPVGNPGNTADTVTPNPGYGAVGYSYNIGTYDVTNSQYVEFLNTKDPTGANTLGLWNDNMVFDGGIKFNAGNANGNKYTLISGAQFHPVNHATWYDSIRFANWLNNGQGNGDTESGAYTLQGGTPTPSNGNSITRNTGATVFLPSENEWYKAAYYNPKTSLYYLYPTSSSLVPTATGPTATPNSANYKSIVGNLTNVGAYTGTTSPYGAFDMGGNEIQWNEALIDGSFRDLRGGSAVSLSIGLLSSSRSAADPSLEGGAFRVASTPEPSTAVLAGFAFGLMWLLRKRFK